MKKARMFLMLCLVFVLAGCSSSRSSMAGTGATVGMYQLRSLDPLHISLLGIPKESQIEAVIDEKGSITLPYIDEPIQASGLTTSELERKIQRIYTDSRIYRNITVIVATTAKTYYMEGEVFRPQEYPLTRRITLMQAVAAAGGYTDYANRNKVTITRNGKVETFDIKDIEKHPETDVPVEAGDRIKVFRSIF